MTTSFQSRKLFAANLWHYIFIMQTKRASPVSMWSRCGTQVLCPCSFVIAFVLYSFWKKNTQLSVFAFTVWQMMETLAVSLIAAPHGQRGSWHQLKRGLADYLTVSPHPGKTLKCLTKTSVLLEVGQSPELCCFWNPCGSIFSLFKHRKESHVPQSFKNSTQQYYYISIFCVNLTLGCITWYQCIPNKYDSNSSVLA